MADTDLLTTLCRSGHLLCAADDHYRRQERHSMLRLLSRPRRTFLQEYDLLFRYVNWWLLARGYVLTGHQPHQVLARVCSQLAPAAVVAEVIRSRHALKYDQCPPTLAAEQGLAQLVSTFMPTCCAEAGVAGRYEMTKAT